MFVRLVLLVKCINSQFYGGAGTIAFGPGTGIAWGRPFPAASAVAGPESVTETSAAGAICLPATRCQDGALGSSMLSPEIHDRTAGQSEQDRQEDSRLPMAS
jgi:hypothetical protein